MLPPTMVSVPSTWMIRLKLSNADVRVMLRNGSTVCLNFSAYVLFGVSQIRLKTGPMIWAESV